MIDRLAAFFELDMHGDILPNPLQAFATDPSE
jgi:hypothetical protein